MKDSNLCQFYKLLVKKFQKDLNKNSKTIEYSNNTFSARNTNNMIIDYVEGYITYDNTTFSYYERKGIKD